MGVQSSHLRVEILVRYYLLAHCLSAATDSYPARRERGASAPQKGKCEAEASRSREGEGMSEWKEVRVQDVSRRITSGGTPSTKISEYYGGNIPWLNTKEINFRPIVKTEQHITELGLANSPAKWIEKNSVIVAMYGATAGKSAISKIALTTNQACCNITVDESKADYRFIYYALVDSYSKLENLASGAAQQNLSVGVISNFEISIPPLPEQRAIAEVLSSLDDKIDLLHRQNKTLESLAETLFRQWFVEDARVDWKEYSLSDFVEHVKEGITPSEFKDTLFYHYSLPAYDENKMPAQELGNDILSNKYKVIPNSILVSKLNPRFPRIWPIIDLLGGNSICSTEFQVLKPKSGKLYGYIYFLLRSKEAIDFLAMSASGTSGSHQRVRPEDILNIEAKFPSIERAKQFSGLAMGHIYKIQFNQHQIQTLEKLRDSLLPKLMGGELKITV